MNDEWFTTLVFLMCMVGLVFACVAALYWLFELPF